eukprot:767337-Hanusia_phi.AAC.1
MASGTPATSAAPPAAGQPVCALAAVVRVGMRGYEGLSIHGVRVVGRCGRAGEGEADRGAGGGTRGPAYDEKEKLRRRQLALAAL